MSAVSRSRVAAAALLAAGALAAAAVLTAGPSVATAAAPPDGACVRTAMPYQGVPGASLTATDHVSKDDRPVRYTRWRGTVPGFDGMPFSVDVTVPCGSTGALPTVVMAHGWTDDKTLWQETGKSDRVVSESRPAANSRWNNIWFASRGYAVVNYTARGWHDSCGPTTPGATPGSPAPQCAGYEYWIHLNDKRWEVRDAQWLAGGMVQSGLADPGRLAITGGSYGGGPALSGALLADRTMCGAAPVPTALGPDPCAGRESGELVAWTTPDGATPLVWAASVPMYTYADLLQVLAPNGRGSDGWELAPPDGNHTDPFGVPKVGTLAALFGAGRAFGFYGPPGDDETDNTTNTARLLAGNPFSQSDPLVARGVEDQKVKSPLTTPPQGRVPIFFVQGFTDPLFPASEALQMLNQVRSTDPAYPIKVFLGDIGHDYTADRQDEWDLAHAQMNTFLDYYLRPDRTPARPVFDVGATVTRCLDPEAPMRYVAAPTWAGLHPGSVTFVSTAAGTTSSATPGPAGAATDPISTATLPLPGSYKGCRIVRPAETDPTVATYLFPVKQELTLMGGPVIDIGFATTAPDTQLHVRMWDVAPDGSEQGLVTRGTFRSLDPPGGGRQARFQLDPQGYRFPAGHKLKVEVTANDAPFFQTSNVPAVVRVQRLEVTMPLLPSSPRSAAAPSAEAADATTNAAGPSPSTASRSQLPATGSSLPGFATLAVLGVALALRRLRRSPSQ